MDICQFSGASKQILACVIACLPVFMTGISLAWPSPAMEFISTGRAPLQLTTEQMSLMIVGIDIGNFVMTVPIGRLMDRMGRRFAVNMSPPLMFVGWMLILFGRQAWCLYVARLVQGAAVGIGWVVVPAYVGEMANAQIRGMLSLLVQISYAVGLLFSYTAGWLLANYTTLAAVSACVSVACSALLSMFLPESPYYLVMEGRSDEAANCLRALRSYTEDDLRLELVAVKNSVLNDRRRGTIRDLVNRDRRPLVIIIVMAVLQMVCGTSVLETYAATVLSGARVPVTANGCAVILGLVVLAAAVPFALAVDRRGRRPLMITSCFGSAVCNAAVAYFLQQQLSSSDTTTGWWIPLFGSMAGVQFFLNIGLVPLLSLVQCEYFPSDTRALADTVAVLTVTLASTIVVLTYQRVADAAVFGVVVDFAAFAVASFVGGVFCYVFMPETKCKTFAEIQIDFHPNIVNPSSVPWIVRPDDKEQQPQDISKTCSGDAEHWKFDYEEI